MKTRALWPVSTARRALHAVVRTGAVAGMAAMLSPPATGQVYIGGEGPPNVVVDYSVLDALGPAPSVPEVLMERPAGRPAAPYSYSNGPRFPLLSGSGRWQHQGPIVLKPPAAVNERPARAARSPAPKLKPPPRKPAPAVIQAAPEVPETPDVTEAAKPPPRKKAPDVAHRAAPEPLMPPPPPKIEPVPAAEAPATPPPRASVAKLPDPPPAPEPSQSAQPASVPSALPAVATVTETKAAPLKAVTAGPNADAVTQIAAMPKPEPAIRPGTLRRIDFVPGSAKLNGNAAEELRAVAEAMARDEALRIQLLAYAGKEGDSESQARRLSLSRALAARSQLIEQGVRSTRIDVRALGNNSAGGPAERVDIIVTKR